MKRLATWCVMLVALLGASPARGQLIPVADFRRTFAQATMLGVTETLNDQPSAPFAYFNSMLNAYVEGPEPEGGGSVQATAFQVSQFFPSGISASGTTGGSWVINPGEYAATSLATFQFRVNACIRYQLDVWLKPGTVPEAGQFLLESEPGHVPYYDIDGGELHVTGQLSAGEYTIEGRSSFTTGIENFSGATYSYFLTCSACPGALIAGQPANVTTPCNTDVLFVVTASGPGPFSYQWRRNGVPLANSGHISGSTGAQLTIHDVCHPDDGYYDVLVTNGAIVEYSQPARLTVTGTTGVDGTSAAAGALQLALAGPSPFTAGTTFRYAASEVESGSIAIYDISGAKIRTLAERLTAGGGMVTWDGRTSAGTRAPAGVYFARIEAAGARETCRVVKLN